MNLLYITVLSKKCTSSLEYEINGIKQKIFLDIFCPDTVGCQYIVDLKPKTDSSPTEVQDKYYRYMYESYASIGVIPGVKRSLVRAVCAATTKLQDCNTMCSHPCRVENNEKTLTVDVHYHGSIGYGPDERSVITLPNYVCSYDDVMLSLNPRPWVIWVSVFSGYAVFIIILVIAIPTYYCQKRRWKCACKRGVNVFNEKMFAERKRAEPDKK